MYVTKKEDRPGWIPGNLNKGHMDRFYLLFAALTSIDFIVYILCSISYTNIAVYKESIEGEELAHIKSVFSSFIRRVLCTDARSYYCKVDL